MDRGADEVIAAMVWLDGGAFEMGSDRHYPEEAPRRPAKVDGFWIDRTPVTNAAFEEFVQATGYVTVAERPPDPASYPDVPPDSLVPGSIVFTPPARREDLRFAGDWWRFVSGCHWRTDADPSHPVVHIAHADAAAYAAWAGKSLPSEAEWEFAAGGGSADEFAWGRDLTPGGVHMANIWQGRFPFENLIEDGFAGTSPVGSFPPNAHGLSDMIGNVWEWTDDAWHGPRDRPCCAPAGGIARKVIKGGSHLCAPNHCMRYRPPARQPQAIDSGTSHIGFRCVRRSIIAP